MTNRREFLASLASATPLAFAGFPFEIPSPSSSRMSDISQVTLERMRPWLQGRFRVLQPDAAQELELIGALELPRHRPGIAEKFSLVFRGPADRGLSQRIYTLDHPQAGRFDLFLVPVGAPEPGVWHYEAIINREIPPASPALPPATSLSTPSPPLS